MLAKQNLQYEQHVIMHQVNKQTKLANEPDDSEYMCELRQQRGYEYGPLLYFE